MNKLPSAERYEKNAAIPEAVAEPSFEDDPEAQPFKISYRFYNDSECELRDLIKNAPRKVLEDLRKIGASIGVSDFRRYNIDIKPVDQRGNYRTLFNRLPSEEVELKENAIQSSGRMFYFIIEKTFYLVALKNAHKETKKVRRH